MAATSEALRAPCTRPCLPVTSPVHIWSGRPQTAIVIEINEQIQETDGHDAATGQ
jgi:hypothetical protein